MMSVLSPAAPRQPIIPTVPVFPLTVQQYHSMIAAGILTTEDRVELLAGILVQKMPKYPPHRISTGKTRDALGAVIPAGWYVDSQEPVTLPDSEPEPNVSVVRGRTDDYFNRHPGPADIGMLVEVSDSSLDRDLQLKLPIYAAAGVQVYWVINLVDRRVEVYTQPTPTGYARRQDFLPGQDVPVILDGQPAGQIRVDDMLP